MAEPGSDGNFSSSKESGISRKPLKVQVRMLSGDTVATVSCESETQIATLRKKAELQADRFFDLSGPSGQIIDEACTVGEALGELEGLEDVSVQAITSNKVQIRRLRATVAGRYEDTDVRQEGEFAIVHTQPDNICREQPVTFGDSPRTRSGQERVLRTTRLYHLPTHRPSDPPLLQKKIEGTFVYTYDGTLGSTAFDQEGSYLYFCKQDRDCVHELFYRHGRPRHRLHRLSDLVQCGPAEINSSGSTSSSNEDDENDDDDDGHHHGDEPGCWRDCTDFWSLDEDFSMHWL